MLIKPVDLIDCKKRSIKVIIKFKALISLMRPQKTFNAYNEE